MKKNQESPQGEEMSTESLIPRIVLPVSVVAIWSLSFWHRGRGPCMGKAEGDEEEETNSKDVSLLQGRCVIS